MAGPTRLERATSSVTGRRSNQLSYEPLCKLLYTNAAEITRGFMRLFRGLVKLALDTFR